MEIQKLLLLGVCTFWVFPCVLPGGLAVELTEGVHEQQGRIVSVHGWVISYGHVTAWCA